MRTGKMTKRVRLEKPSEVQADSGELQNLGFALVSELWAEIEELSGREFFQAQQTQAGASVRVRTRYNASVTEKMRFVYKGTAYDILGVTHTNASTRETVCVCAKGSAQGYKKEGYNG